MKKWLFFLIILVAVAFLPKLQNAGTDVAQLLPVQTVAITRQGGQIVLRTDTVASGVGEDFTEALENLHATTPARVFLETAEYLLIDPALLNLLPSLLNDLRPSCRVCKLEGEGDLTLVGDYLRIHQPKSALLACLSDPAQIPTLKLTREGMNLVP